MVQTGDPSGTGKGGESIFGKPFHDEIKASLKASPSVNQVIHPVSIISEAYFPWLIKVRSSKKSND
jgi:cyclophilin family peptidyl-prolyl cis-trans isomerase